MKIRVFSDLHHEHHQDQGAGFVRDLNAEGTDVVVLAGDISDVRSGLFNTLARFCEKFPVVLYVAGNHDHGFAHREKLHGVLRKVARRHANFHALQRDVVTINGQRFLGATLWFPDSRPARLQASLWSDFGMIPSFASWVYEESAKDVLFFRRELQEGDVAITHYLPSWRSVHPQWAHSTTNCYFVNDIEYLIRERKPALWVHGHTHSSADYMLDTTRVVCNPFGYAGLALNAKFREDLVVEISRSGHGEEVPGSDRDRDGG